MLTEIEFDHRLAQLWQLVHGAHNLSAALAWWTGRGTPTIHVLGSRERVLHAGEYVDLQGHRHSTGHERVGLLSTPRDGRTLALTRALVIPDRIPRSVRLECGIPHSDHPEVGHATRVPLGVAFAAEYGNRFRRVGQTVRSIVGHEDASGERMSLECTATLLLDDHPIGLVAEQFTRAAVEDYAPPGEVADYLAQGRVAVSAVNRLHWWPGRATARWWHSRRTTSSDAGRRRVG